MEDFKAMAKEKTARIQRLLEEFKDDQLDMTLQLEAKEKKADGNTTTNGADHPKR